MDRGVAVFYPGDVELAGVERELLPFEVDGFAYAQAVAVHDGN